MTGSPKAMLRAQALIRRNAYRASLSAAQSAAQLAGLAAVVARQLTRPGIVATYAAMGSEIDPADVLPDAPRLFPRVAGTASPLTFHDVPRSALRAGGRGVMEPPASAPTAEPDVVLVPLLLVDRYGIRIGYGGGFYDRTLAALRSRRRILAVGCAWDMQVVARLPADPWDAPLDAIATPTQWLQPPGAAR